MPAGVDTDCSSIQQSLPKLISRKEVNAMVATTTFYLEGQDRAKIALTREGLSALLMQVEAELQRSDTYQQALNHLSQGMEETSQSCQAVVRAVGREAIRLALRQVVRQYRATPPASGLPEDLSKPFIAPSLTVDDTPSPSETDSEEETASISPIEVEPTVEPPQPKAAAPLSQPIPNATSGPIVQRPPAKPLSPDAEKRAAILQQIGQTLRQARQTQGISLEQLHLQTWVPIHQLRALESGQADKLPEDIYIQGFLRRLAPVLKLDGNELQGFLKPLQPSRNAVPSWQRPESTSSTPSLQPIHLYIGYAALMAGAAGGLMWMSQQPHSLHWEPDLTDYEPEARINSSSDVDAMVTPQSAGGGGAIASPETAPPQTLR